jgi:general secretion pathway protein C
MTINDNLTSFTSNLAKLPHQKIAVAISSVLLIYIAFLAAKITWLLVPQEPMTSGKTGTVIGVKQSGSTQERYNLSQLQSLNLFGQYNEQVKEVVEQVITDAPVTRLKLTLSGLVASDNQETAAAIIEYQGKQETYGVGDVIFGTRASLEQVLVDRVIIKQSGRAETLMLDGADYNQPAQNIANKKVALKAKEIDSNSPTKNKKTNIVDQRSNSELSKSALKLRADLSKDPGKIADYLRISPARKNGKIVGYRLSPGKSPEFFKLSGLKSGDIAVQMNGYDLLAPAEAAQALAALQTERELSVLVERKNDLVEILFSIE